MTGIHPLSLEHFLLFSPALPCPALPFFVDTYIYAFVSAGRAAAVPVADDAVAAAARPVGGVRRRGWLF